MLAYLEYNTAIWYIVCLFGVFFKSFCIHFPRFGKLSQDKSGNPADEGRKSSFCFRADIKRIGEGRLLFSGQLSKQEQPLIN
jgi:hypothetical protein